jgi:D-proline reductase (dithiol) PrdB
MKMKLYRLKNKFLSKIAAHVPWIERKMVQSEVCRMETNGASSHCSVPWSPPRKSLCVSRVALVTTAGVHHTTDEPFNMEDPDGDPTFREIDGHGRDLMITHDYYDHTDADRDINVVFPLERLKELADEGLLGDVAPLHYSFMGHITGPHMKTLICQTAPEVARRLKSQGVEVALLTPG